MFEFSLLSVTIGRQLGERLGTVPGAKHGMPS